MSCNCLKAASERSRCEQTQREMKKLFCWLFTVIMSEPSTTLWWFENTSLFIINAFYLLHTQSDESYLDETWCRYQQMLSVTVTCMHNTSHDSLVDICCNCGISSWEGCGYWGDKHTAADISALSSKDSEKRVQYRKDNLSQNSRNAVEKSRKHRSQEHTETVLLKLWTMTCMNQTVSLLLCEEHGVRIALYELETNHCNRMNKMQRENAEQRVEKRNNISFQHLKHEREWL